MSLKTFFVKVGRDIVEGVEYPFKHAAQLGRILQKGINVAEVTIAEAPAIKDLLVGLVEAFEKLGPDVLADIAAKGFDFSADVQTVTDLKAAFAYFTGTFLPGVEKLYAGLFPPSDSASPTSAVPAAAVPAAAVAAAGPGVVVHQ